MNCHCQLEDCSGRVVSAVGTNLAWRVAKQKSIEVHEKTGFLLEAPFIGIMEKRMETTTMENQMEKKMENEMEIGKLKQWAAHSFATKSK